MEDAGQFTRAARLLVVTASLVVVVAGMKAATAILVPFLLALFLALLCLPAVRWMHRAHVPNALAVPAVLVVALVLGAVILSVLTASVAQFASDLPRYVERVSDLRDSARAWLESHTDIRIPDKTLRNLDPSKVLGFVSATLGQFTNLLGNLALIVLMVAFTISELLVLPRKLAAVKTSAEDRGALERIVRAINQYISIKTFVSFLTGASAGGLCGIVGVPYPVLWGMVAFLLNYIPNIGSILAAIPPVLITLIEPGLGLAPALVVAGGYTAINVVFGNVVEPRMMGRSLDLSTLVVFVSMVFWGWVLGAVGMFLSVPLTMVLKIALEGSPSTRPIALLLGSAPDPESAGS